MTNQFKDKKDKQEKKASSNSNNLILDPSNFIKLSSITLDGNKVDMLAAKYVLQVNKEIEKALNSLGYPAQVKDARGNITQKGYTKEKIWVDNRLGSLDWYEQIPLIEFLDSSRLIEKQWLDFYALLRNGLEGKVEVMDGRNQIISKDEIKDIIDKMLKKEGPWRSEYFDDRYEVTDKSIIIYSGHYTDQSLTLQERIKPDNIKHKYKKEIPKKDIEMNNGWTNFSNFDEQGLCTKLEQGGEVYNWPPVNNCVVGSVADSGRVILFSDRGRASGPGLSVRLAKILK